MLVNFQITSFYQCQKTLVSYWSYFPSVTSLISHYGTSEWLKWLFLVQLDHLGFCFQSHTLFFWIYSEISLPLITLKTLFRINLWERSNKSCFLKRFSVHPKPVWKKVWILIKSNTVLGYFPLAAALVGFWFWFWFFVGVVHMIIFIWKETFQQCAGYVLVLLYS